jgi:hypothetical protein
MTPTPEQLIKLRKGLRKRKLPKLFDGMHYCVPEKGIFNVYEHEQDFRIEYLLGSTDHKAKRNVAFFSELNSSPDLELTRYNIGMLISAAYETESNKVFNFISGPKEGMAACAPILKEADNWAHWAIVKAGHFLK